MPPRFRTRLLALALAAIVFGCAAPTASARLDGPPRRERPKPTLGQRAAKVALRAVGVPYRWGGSSPASGFDCSGLVYWAYGRLGVAVPHSSYALYGLGRSIRRSRLRAGDVLFFSGLGHVGLYIGRGRMVHAPQSGRTVEVVRLARSHYGGRIVGARRLVS
jgi:cell wall-associated NlpC family hydrolase